MWNKVDSNCTLVFINNFDQSHQTAMSSNKCTRNVVKLNNKNEFAHLIFFRVFPGLSILTIIQI